MLIVIRKSFYKIGNERRREADIHIFVVDEYVGLSFAGSAVEFEPFRTVFDRDGHFKRLGFSIYCNVCRAYLNAEQRLGKSVDIYLRRAFLLVEYERFFDIERKNRV